MKLGIIGKPQCGKTTIFNAASGHQEAVGDFSQAIHRAVIKVPDERLDRISEIIKPKKTTYAEIEFLDAPGFSGKGKQSDNLEINPEIRLMEALIAVVDGFSPDADPKTDIRALLDEMVLADLEQLERNINKKTKRAKVTGDRAETREVDLLKKCNSHLEEEKLLIDLELASDERKIVRGYNFLTQKPLLIVVNISEEKIGQADEIEASFSEFVVTGKRSVAVICGKIEMELALLDAEDREMFMQELKISTPAVQRVIQESYSLLGLISFITAGEPDVRAWTIRKGTVAKEAAGAVHDDMERGFIRAEITSYEDFLKYKSMSALRSAGKNRVEGKEYEVCDGDIILFRFNV